MTVSGNHALDDWQIPMARNGRALCFDAWITDLGAHAATCGAYRDLIMHRYCENLFSSPLWGVLFDFDTETTNADASTSH